PEINIEWTGLESDSHERCHVTDRPDGVTITSTVSGSDDVACTYTASVDPAWNFQSVRLRTATAELSLRHTAGGWLVDDDHRPDLAEALEIDISVSPLSNTFPVRRLGLEIGQSADIVTAYISLPDLGVFPDPQRYTRTGEREYLYESRDSDFSRTVTVDEAGFVLDYPGLFWRTR
ncbi:MAG: putative glycolipid-binding domain-containing protein, partial [Brevibacterium sp.]